MMDRNRSTLFPKSILPHSSGTFFLIVAVLTVVGVVGGVDIFVAVVALGRIAMP